MLEQSLEKLIRDWGYEGDIPYSFYGISDQNLDKEIENTKQRLLILEKRKREIGK